MDNQTRKAFRAYSATIAKLNGVDTATESFSVTPSVQQKLEKTMQESSSFLKQINVIAVKEMTGAKVGVGVTGTIAGRTDTSTGPRVPRDVSDLKSDPYLCVQTNFDTSIPYALLDAWAGHADFQPKLAMSIINQQALDRIMIGFNGVEAATETDRDTYPLLEDVNIGWLQKYRANAPDRVMTEVVDSSGEVNVGATGDYKNMDALVYDAKTSLIDKVHQKNPNLVVLASSDLVDEKYFNLLNNNSEPSEILSADLIISQQKLGGLRIAQAPFFPDGTIMITTLKNLSIYWQKDRRRRLLKDHPERDRIENFESSNDAYVVESYGAGCVVENIKLV